MLRALRQAGFAAPHVVAAQAEPDPDFPTVAFPNPEEPGALDLALADARRLGADLVVASDPDGDRLAVAVPDPDAGWRVLTGDQVGALLGASLIRASSDPGQVDPGQVDRGQLDRGQRAGTDRCRAGWLRRGRGAAGGVHRRLLDAAVQDRGRGRRPLRRDADRVQVDRPGGGWRPGYALRVRLRGGARLRGRRRGARQGRHRRRPGHAPAGGNGEIGGPFGPRCLRRPGEGARRAPDLPADPADGRPGARHERAQVLPAGRLRRRARVRPHRPRREPRGGRRGGRAWRAGAAGRRADLPAARQLGWCCARAAPSRRSSATSRSPNRSRAARSGPLARPPPNAWLRCGPRSKRCWQAPDEWSAAGVQPLLFFPAVLQQNETSGRRPA